MTITLLPLLMVYIFLLKQPVEWNEEVEEQVGAESPALVTDDTGEQSSEKKDDDVVNFTEENEWDRLLRMRLSSLLLRVQRLSSVICFAQSDIGRSDYLLLVS